MWREMEEGGLQRSGNRDALYFTSRRKREEKEVDGSRWGKKRKLGWGLGNEHINLSHTGGEDK